MKIKHQNLFLEVIEKLISYFKFGTIIVYNPFDVLCAVLVGKL